MSRAASFARRANKLKPRNGNGKKGGNNNSNQNRVGGSGAKSTSQRKQSGDRRSTTTTSGARDVVVKEKSLNFSARPGETDTIKLKISNLSTRVRRIGFAVVGPAFIIRNVTVDLRPRSFVQLPIDFAPRTKGWHEGMLLLTGDTDTPLRVSLRGRAASD